MTKKWSVGNKIFAGFAVALATIVVLRMITWSTANGLIETADWVTHTHKVLETLENVLSLMKDAETGQRGYLITGEDRYLEPYRNAKQGVDKGVQDLLVLTADNPHEQQRLAKIVPLIDGKFAELTETIKLRKTVGFQAALQVVITDRGKNLMDDCRKIIHEMQDEENSLLKRRDEEAKDSVRALNFISVIGIILSFIILGLICLVLTRNISNPLRELSNTAEKISSGDLTSNLNMDSDRQDEVGLLTQAFVRMIKYMQTMATTAEQIAGGDLTVKAQPQSSKDILGNSFASMIENLRRMTGQISDLTNVLGGTVSEILASTTQVAASMSETAAAVTETTTTVEEVRQTAHLSNQKGKLVAESAQKALHISEIGKKSTDATLTGMKQIREQTELIATSMIRLSEQSQAIGNIVATVEDLSQQSNLLAVNAAIEAAKAGEHGKGFTVVAQEVKSLADQSKQATTQVRSILNDIQKATSAASIATEQGSKSVEAGLKQSTEAGDSITGLTTSVAEAAQAATLIAASSQQQLVGMDQVATAMEGIKEAASQNASAMKQLDEAARDLNKLGQNLKQLVSQYKV